MPYKAEPSGSLSMHTLSRGVVWVSVKRKVKDEKPTIYEERRHHIVRKQRLPKSELELQKRIDKEERAIKKFFNKFLYSV